MFKFVFVGRQNPAVIFCDSLTSCQVDRHLTSPSLSYFYSSLDIFLSLCCFLTLTLRWSVSGMLTDSPSHTSCSCRACVCVWRALTDSVWVCDRGCQRSVREMCLVSHSADPISGRTVHSGPAVAPYITPAVIHTPAWRDPPASVRARSHAHIQLLYDVHTIYRHLQ